MKNEVLPTKDSASFFLIAAPARCASVRVPAVSLSPPQTKTSLESELNSLSEAPRLFSANLLSLLVALVKSAARISFDHVSAVSLSPPQTKTSPLGWLWLWWRQAH